MKEFRLKCDHCKRIIASDTDKSIPCSACGHGVLRVQRPKNYCDTCGSPIYDNVRSDCRVTCGNCTMDLIEKVRRIENTAHVQITGKGSAKIYKEVAKIAEQKVGRKSMSGLLAPIRKSKGFSQRLLAEELGISQNYLSEMEHGRKLLNIKALQWIKENLLEETV
jgi:ribosome-binding protein aMBF1 (putative translation factor)